MVKHAHSAVANTVPPRWMAMTSKLILGYASWIAPAVLLGIVAVRMAYTKARNEFPWFFYYSVFQILRTSALLPLYQLAKHYGVGVYFYPYWVLEVVDGALTLAVIHELYTFAFYRYDALRRLGEVLFGWSLGLLCLLAVVVTSLEQGKEFDRLIKGILVLDEGFVLVACGMVLLLLLVGSHFHLCWDRHAFGIAVGMILYLTFYFAGAFVRREYGLPAQNLMATARVLSYNCAVGIWIFALWASDPVKSAESFRADMGELQRWNDALAEMLRV